MQSSYIKLMENASRNNSDITSLSQGVPSFDYMNKLIYRIISRIKYPDLNKYSDSQGLYSLRNAIVESSKSKSEIAAENIIISSGATEALATALLALTKFHDEILIPTPTYSAFFRISEMAKLRVKQINCTLGSLDSEDIMSSITEKTKVILLCNPNNPTGVIYKKKDLDRICNVAINKNILLIIDETYRDFVYNKINFYSPLKALKSNKLIIISSFSKCYALSGWRIGYLTAGSRLIDKMLPYHESIANCAPVISQYAILELLKSQKFIVNKHIESLLLKKDIVSNSLKRLSQYIEYAEPEGAYFYFPKLKIHTHDLLFCKDLLDKGKLAVAPGVDFGEGGNGHFRICFGRDKGNLLSGMLKLERYFKKYYE